LFAAIFACPYASGASELDFYSGKTIQIIVPFSPGGYYDVSSRILAKYMQAELPGKPNIVVQNQPGGGGITAANRLSSGIARDGLTLAVVGRGVPQLALLKDPNVTFDPLRLTWLGSLSAYENDAHLLVINRGSSIKSVNDARANTLHLGAGVAGSTNTTFSLLARDLLGLKIDLVRGFPGSNDIWLSMERGEVDGQLADLSGIMTARPHMWKGGNLRALVQFGRLKRMPGLEDVPTGRELIKNDADRQLLEFAEIPFFMSLPFAAPPDIPEDRASILKATFMKVAADPKFKAELEQAGIGADPIDGDVVRSVLQKGAQVDQSVLLRFNKLLKE
jgi:tripartite-type tricarboxylate transporter receptor subunit TctC